MSHEQFEHWRRGFFCVLRGSKAKESICAESVPKAAAQKQFLGTARMELVLLKEGDEGERKKESGGVGERTDGRRLVCVSL
mmetsp:Transcript_16330/g.24159  ORF Transcript_16330/g.24159 Transcript_16330/m.24159 type:complete len:81 (-) Transcript_16330:36-278(-)